MKKTIGRIDKADFPLLGFKNIAVKIDTGAYTSSIHCKNIQEENGRLKCNFLDQEHPNYNGREILFNNYQIAQVKSSNGSVQSRFKIETHILIFNEIFPIFLTLSDREEMKYPVLLGRNFLNKNFIVDPQLANISFKQQRKQ